MSRTAQLRASPRMFDNGVLDRLSRVHPAVPVVLYVPAIAVLAAVGVSRAGAPATAGLALAGWVAWTLTEYWLHRVVFHLEPTGGLGARLHWIVHGVHHDHPNDPRRLVMPPAVSVPLSAGLCLLFWAALGAGAAPAFAAGFLAGYLVYDTTHFALHHRVPRSRIGRRLREHHLRHHFEDDERGFGVSAPWWDVLFGTAPGGRRRLRSVRNGNVSGT